MNAPVKATMRISKVIPAFSEDDMVPCERVEFVCVNNPDFKSATRIDEVNTFALWFACGGVKLFVTNPDLFGKLKLDEIYHVDFTLMEAHP